MHRKRKGKSRSNRTARVFAGISCLCVLSPVTAFASTGVYSSGSDITISTSNITTEADGIIAVTGGGNPVAIGTTSCDQLASVGPTTTFTASGAGDWFDAANWDNGVPAGTTDLTVVPSGGTALIGAEASAGTFLDICGGTVDVQSGGSLFATGSTLIGEGGTLFLSGSTIAPLDIAIDDGTIRAATTGTLASNLYIGNTSPVTISEAASQTLTLTGDFENYFGDYKIIFGSPTDTGTVVFSPLNVAYGSGLNVPIEIAGGTLKAGNNALGSLLNPASITVDAGATLDLNDQEPTNSNIVFNLLGAGNVVTGSSSGTTLTLGAGDFSGSISGAGNVVVSSVCYGTTPQCTSGLVTLSGTNTFTGTTTVSDGTLIIENGAAITNSSAMTINSGGILTLDGAFDGYDLAINSGGAATINGTTTASVGVNMGGTLTVSSGGMIDGDGVGVAGTLIVQGSIHADDGGMAISSGGEATIDGTAHMSSLSVAGTMIINGSATSSGDSTVEQYGNLTVSSDASLSAQHDVIVVGNFHADGAVAAANDIVVFNGGTLTANGSVSNSGEIDVQWGGALTVSSTGSILQSGSLTVAGTLTANGPVSTSGVLNVSPNGMLVVNTGGSIVNASAIAIDDGSVTDNGSISTTGLVSISGGGSMMISSTGTIAHSSGLTLDGAQLIDNGTIVSSGNLSVGGGGMLAGTGTIPTTQVLSGGIVVPGDGGVGTLHVNGNLSIANGGIIDVDLSANNSDKLAVTGSATLGGTLNVTLLSSPVTGTEYTVLTTTDGITGTFATPAPVQLGEFQEVIHYDTNDVILQYDLATLSTDLPVIATQNEIAVAGGIDSAIVPGTPLPDAFQALADLSAPDLATAATQLSGEMAADLPQIESTAVDPFLNLIVNRSGNTGQDINGAGRFHGDHDAVDTWMSGYGEHSSITGDTSQTGSHSVSGSTIGGAAGLDVRVVRGLIIGAGFGYGHTTFSLSDDLGSGRSNDLQFGIHALADFGRHAYFSAGGVYALQDVTTHRAITTPAAENLDAKFTAHDMAARAETGYRLPLSSSSQLTPFMAAQWDSLDAPSYGETGSADYALTYDPNRATNARAELGAALDDVMQITYNTDLFLDGRAAFGHAFESSSDAHAAFTSLPGSDFVVQGATPGSNLALLSFDAVLKGRNGFSLGFEGDGSLSQNSQSYFATADLSYTW